MIEFDEFPDDSRLEDQKFNLSQIKSPSTAHKLDRSRIANPNLTSSARSKC